MGKNKKANTKHTDLGRQLIKGKNQEKRHVGQTLKKDSWLHTSEIQDGYDWNRLNLQSVTEQSTLDDFLETAELAGVEFTAEKLNVKIVGAGTITGVLGEAEMSRVEKLQKDNMKLITIPRRPAWDESTSPEQLEVSERECFLNWRRSLALLQEDKGLLLTPYEKNLDVWRQLWRVIERSDVICQIVDGRNPLLYKSDDLAAYVKETNSSKEYIILINKADYLSLEQRKYWSDYFTAQKAKVIFWSALEQSVVTETEECDSNLADDLKSLDVSDENQNQTTTTECTPNDIQTVPSCVPSTLDENNVDLVSRSGLIDIFKSFEKVNMDDDVPYVTIGLVGYPNVGKSSTINALLKDKKVAVSATPGKTKHFQTLFYDENLCLCDCPGLVFPTFVTTKAEMVLNGILPIDQLRDWVAPSTILAQRIPRKIVENTYGINIAKPKEGEDSTRHPTAEEVLSSYALNVLTITEIENNGRLSPRRRNIPECYTLSSKVITDRYFDLCIITFNIVKGMRGFMTAHGLPDCPRASRYILKDYIRGKLLYCHPPPEVSVENFKPCTMSEKALEKFLIREEKEAKKSIKEPKTQSMHTSVVDDEFFAEKAPSIHYKSPMGGTRYSNTKSTGPTGSSEEQYVVHKPWKKHGNRNKKEKLRRIYTDQ